MTVWVEQIERRARLIHDEIAVWQNRAAYLNVDPTEACKDLYKILDEIYTVDLPLARARDNSDLLLHIEGEAVIGDPRLSFVSYIFNNVKSQVRDLAKVISGIHDQSRVTVRDIDLGLSGLARGSLFVGFNAPAPGSLSDQWNLLGDMDPIYAATREALRSISVASRIVQAKTDDEVLEGAYSEFRDPAVRDTALIALKQISPSGRRGVDRISVSSHFDGTSSGELTSETRSMLRRVLRKPVHSEEEIELEGKIREIDLDAKRFELRRVSNYKIQDIRVIYSGVENIFPRSLLDSTVRVRGLIERKGDNSPRLLMLQNVELLSRPSE